MNCLRHVRSERLRPTGFTLIELLVVIAVIALLAAILFPVFARARENARRSSCASNMKQIGLGLLQYIQDYDERTPVQDAVVSVNSGNISDYSNPLALNNWIRSLQPYTKSWELFRCPSAADETVVAANTPIGNSRASYSVNGVVTGRSVAVIPSTSDIIWSQERITVIRHSTVRPCPEVGPGPGAYQLWQASTLSGIHFSGGNLLFCDGHVKWKSQMSIASADFGLGGGYVGVNASYTSATSLW